MSTAVRQRQRVQRGENRARIVDTAEELLRSGRIRDLSIEEIMERAGLTRTIFYRHFDDVFDLVVTVAAGAFDDLFEEQARLAAAGPMDAERLRAIMRAGVKAFTRHGPLLRAVIEGAALDEEVERAYHERLDRFTELSAGHLTAAGFADAHETARAFTLLNVGYLMDAYGRGQRVPAATAERTLTELWQRAFGLA